MPGCGRSTWESISGSTDTMAIELKQQLKLSQQLVMTPQLQQAIKLLQLSQLDLVSLVEQEMQENPVPEDATVEEEGAGSEAEAPAHQGRRGDVQYSWIRLRSGLSG